MEHSVSQRKKQESSGSREARGSAGPVILLLTGTTGPVLSCYSLGSVLWRMPCHPEELYLNWTQQEEVQDEYGRSYQNL